MNSPSLHQDRPALSPEEWEEIRRDLTADLPAIGTHFLYDDVGSELFEEITELPEYYQTRTELAILGEQGDRIVTDAASLHLAELGSGAGRKIGLVIDAMERAQGCRSLALFDVNATFLTESVERIAAHHPGVDVRGVVGRFGPDLHRLGPGGRRTICFFGSTIGNLRPERTAPFLRRLSGITGPDDSLLIGFDLVKDVRELEAAYNDSRGVTAAFNLNILRAFNAAVGSNFEPDDFEHVAFFDAERSWIDIRLRARRATSVAVPRLALKRRFAAGDELRTEISCKYTRSSVEAYAQTAGLALAGWYTDERERFALALLRSARS